MVTVGRCAARTLEVAHERAGKTTNALTGMSWRDAGALGVLMNTRGLMELVILNVGLELGILTPPLFAMFVLMALATTFMTTPLLSLFQKRAPYRPALQAIVQP